MLPAIAPARARFCLSILLSRSCPCRGCRARSIRPSQECDCPWRTLPLLPRRRLSGEDIVSDRPGQRCLGSAPSRNCGPRVLEDAAAPNAASGPAGMKENKQRTDMMLRGDGQKLIDAFLETVGVPLPKQIVEEDAHGVHAERFRPAQFLIDLIWIERGLLPHFQFVYGGTRDVIATDKPWLLRVPIIRFFLRPANRVRPSCTRTCGSKHDDRRQENKPHYFHEGTPLRI